MARGGNTVDSLNTSHLASNDENINFRNNSSDDDNDDDFINAYNK